MPNQIRLIIVSGLSGSGKTVALHVLEDLGCALPASSAHFAARPGSHAVSP